MSKKYWWTAIEDARAVGMFSPTAKTRSVDWVTCACGEQDPAIPRRPGGEPVDKRLFQLGIGFADVVLGNDPDSAAGILLAIEARATEVLAAQREAK